MTYAGRRSAAEKIIRRLAVASVKVPGLYNRSDIIKEN